MSLLVGACSGRRPETLGVTDGKFAPCPDSPNCVSSQSDDPDHVIEPLRYEGTPQAAREQLLSVIRKMKRVNIIIEQEHYLRVEYTSAVFRFVDDVEFFFDPSKKLIHVRSASRIGYSDLGVNRQRVEQIRTAFAE
jgi:uncharacterized protein (DUF1499 family)